LEYLLKENRNEAEKACNKQAENHSRKSKLWEQQLRLIISEIQRQAANSARQKREDKTAEMSLSQLGQINMEGRTFFIPKLSRN
jgi:hypothetical protein